MRGYRICREENNWYFEFIPNNNPNQPIGRSKMFSSREACMRGLKDFRDMVIQNQIDSVESPYVKMTVWNDGKRAQVAYIKDEDVIYRSREYQDSSVEANCKKTVASIFKHIDDYTEIEVKEGT
ncbi:MAG: hypothetical protein IJC15_06715 [Clostridia bacterium]|nr:hypothetical protein [Clostridia bacterium]